MGILIYLRYKNEPLIKYQRYKNEPLYQRYKNEPYQRFKFIPLN